MNETDTLLDEGQTVETEMTEEELAEARGDFVEEPDQETAGDDELSEDDINSLADLAGSAATDDDGGGETAGGDEAKGGEEGSAEGSDQGGENTDKGEQYPETMPYSRFAYEVKKRHELKEQFNDLQEQHKSLLDLFNKSMAGKGQGDQGGDAGANNTGGATDEFNLEEKLVEHSEAVANGDVEEASKLMKEIIDNQVNMSKNMAAQAIREYEAGLEQKSAESLVNEILSEHKDFFKDPVQLKAFDSLKISLITEDGYSLKDALVAAKKAFFGEKETGGDSKNTDTDDADDLRAKALAAQKKKSIERNADASKRQPPSTAAAGHGQRGKATKKGALAFSEKEYSQMTEEEKAEARGDVL